MTISLAYLDEATLVAQEFFAMLVSGCASRASTANCCARRTQTPLGTGSRLNTWTAPTTPSCPSGVQLPAARQLAHLERAYIRSLEAQLHRTMASAVHRRRVDDGRRRHLRHVRPGKHVVETLPQMQ
ncbi:hypothetical protein GS416_05705, partial [Rhodococcus hoagii]|nr:hypothetical protein [Prescottella equi]